MRVLQAIAAPIVLDADGIAKTQTPGAAGNLTINGDTAATYPYFSGYTSSTRTEVRLDPPRPVSITSDGADSGKTFTVTGVDRAGMPITEVITGPATATVSGSKLFARVFSIAVSAATAGAITAGWTADSYSRWIFLGNDCEDYQTRMRVLLGGTATFEVQATSMSMNVRALHGEGRADTAPTYTGGDNPDDIIVVQASGSTALNTDLAAPYVAIRLKVTAQNANVTLRLLKSRG